MASIPVTGIDHIYILEVVAMRKLRALVRDNWDKLTEFVDPVAKAGLLK